MLNTKSILTLFLLLSFPLVFSKSFGIFKFSPLCTTIDKAPDTAPFARAIQEGIPK